MDPHCAPSSFRKISACIGLSSVPASIMHTILSPLASQIFLSSPTCAYTLCKIFRRFTTPEPNCGEGEFLLVTERPDPFLPSNCFRGNAASVGSIPRWISLSYFSSRSTNSLSSTTPGESGD